MGSSDDRLTPARRQYLQLKRRHPDALLLFRMGDFYELFDDDAVVASRDLHITLTSREFGRGNRVPMAGVPHHALNSYMRRLLAKGHRVAICEQLSEAGHGLVERDIVRVLSPGTIAEPGLLAARENNYLVALNPGRGGTGLAFVDVSTGEFAVTEFAATEDAALAAEIERLNPAECLVPEGHVPPQPPTCPLTVCPPRWFHEGPARDRLLRHFRTASLEPFGCDGLPLATGAAAAVLAYVEGTNRDLLRLLRGLHAYTTSAHVALDTHTRRNLELTRAARSGERSGSLLATLDHTRTAMGGRLLRRWLNRPLQDVVALNERLDVVEALAGNPERRAALIALLDGAGDIERLAGRAAQGAATPRDILALAKGLRAAGAIAATLTYPAWQPASEATHTEIATGNTSTGYAEENGSRSTPERRVAEAGHNRQNHTGQEGPLSALADRIDPAADIAELIERAVSDEDGRMVRHGFDPELDELTDAVGTAQQTLLGIERRERERSGIRSLKVGFNKVFGYYIEVSKSNLKHVPADFIRRQTLANGERFVTPELKEWEARILRAEERITERSTQVFTSVMETAGAQIERLTRTATTLSELDVLSTFAELAVQRSYCRPALDTGGHIEIIAGRHPVVERTLDDGAFVPNDTVLATEDLTPNPSPRRRGEPETSSTLTEAVDHLEGHQHSENEPASTLVSPLLVGEGLGVRSRLLLITGPNMAGKSTYLRQAALIVLMAQVGCFVPAEQARIGVVDRIFTRVGAQDDLAGGASTFLVEMVETAAILRHATSRSLLVFDEVGRGTSTFDGLAIAQAVVEDVHDRIGARTLFATHFHELTALASRLPAMRNYNAAATEEDGRVVFLRRVIPGGADRSYGIHVARLAGLPEHVTARAEELLAGLHGSAPTTVTDPGAPVLSAVTLAATVTADPTAAGRVEDTTAIAGAPPATAEQRDDTVGTAASSGATAFASRDGRTDSSAPGCAVCTAGHERRIVEALRRINLASTTPVQALNLLLALQERIEDTPDCACGRMLPRPRLAVVSPPGHAWNADMAP
jgi:DNA mismatch repair protein MutS